MIGKKRGLAERGCKGQGGMARTQSVDDDDLIARLACVFRERGYEAASLAVLSKAAGLQKASLYHRFPGGKRQMAEEVLGAAMAWFETNVLAPLRRPGPPAERLGEVISKLSTKH